MGDARWWVDVVVWLKIYQFSAFHLLLLLLQGFVPRSAGVNWVNSKCGAHTCGIVWCWELISRGLARVCCTSWQVERLCYGRRGWDGGADCSFLRGYKLNKQSINQTLMRGLLVDRLEDFPMFRISWSCRFLQYITLGLLICLCLYFNSISTFARSEMLSNFYGIPSKKRKKQLCDLNQNCQHFIKFIKARS